MVLNFANRELRFDPMLATPLYLYAGCSIQNFRRQIPEWRPLALGSNCTSIIGDNRTVFAWGEFKAGNQRARNISDEVNKPGVRRKGVNSTLKSILVSNGQDNAPLFNLTKLPKEIELPKEILEDDQIGVVFSSSHFNKKDLQFCQVACGTEHILLLTSTGRVYTLGVNRFGQCGVGHSQVVAKLTVS